MAKVPIVEHTSGSTVGEVAAAANVSGSAIRFYEANGLIHGHRTASNQRRFPADTACRVQVIRVCQRVGLSVAEIRDLLDVLPANGHAGVADWQRLRARVEDEVRIRIRRLDEVLSDLTSDTKLCEVRTIDDVRESGIRADQGQIA